MYVHGEPARRPQTVVVLAGDATAEAGDVDTCAEERAQGDEVVVGRPLAVYPVAPHVGQQVLLQTRPRVGRAAPFRVECRQAEGDDEQGEQLECPMVALRGQVGGDVVELRSHAREHPVANVRLQAGELRYAVEALPRVQPVLQPAGGDVARVDAGLPLVDPARHQALPGVEVAPGHR